MMAAGGCRRKASGTILNAAITRRGKVVPVAAMRELRVKNAAADSDNLNSCIKSGR